MEYKFLSFRKEDGVAWIVKNRPPQNSINQGMMMELKAALEDVAADDDVRVVVIDAQGGEQQFHGGADIREMMTDPNASIWAWRDAIQAGHRVYAMIEDLPKPVIAVVRGGALGGGCEMTLACDFVIAAEDARFSQPEVAVGILPGWGGTQRLPRLVGPRKAAQMIIACDPVTGKEAEAIGLVTKAVPKDQLDAEVERLVNNLKSKSPTVIGLAKMALKVAMDSNLKDGLRYEAEAEALCATTPQRLEAWKARFEGRAPVFQKERRLTPGDDWK